MMIMHSDGGGSDSDACIEGRPSQMPPLDQRVVKLSMKSVLCFISRCDTLYFI